MKMEFTITSGACIHPRDSIVYSDMALGVPNGLLNAICRDDIEEFEKEIEKCGRLDKNKEFIGKQEIFTIRWFIGVHNSEKCRSSLNEYVGGFTTPEPWG